MTIAIIGGGLAGSEAAWQLATRGVPVRVLEMKPVKYSPAHSSPLFGELVCSNSLRSAEIHSAPGLLKEELRILGSLIIQAADWARVPAGKALAVDRELFAEFITKKLSEHPLVTMEQGEVTSMPGAAEGTIIVASGPLTSDALARDISRVLGADGLSFYDAVAPIVSAESLDRNKLFKASRYDETEGDYLNAPMDESLYRSFVNEILSARKVDPYPFEQIPHFEGCLPVEVLASRGPETLAFGPMKPVGLKDPRTGERPYAVVQLRAENKEESMYNLVGFQTKMTYGEQERIFRMIPGLERAEFIRLGSVHRNTYLDAPRLLDTYSRARKAPHVFFAGQITGVEGYIESTASGLAVALMAGLIRAGLAPNTPPTDTAVGGLLGHTRNCLSKRFEPMNVNFGIIDPAPKGCPKKLRKEAVAKRAISSIQQWKARIDELWRSVG